MEGNVSVGIKLTINYNDIKASTEEEAKQIARSRVLEYIDSNSAEFDKYSGITAYCAYLNENVEQFINEDRCIICGNAIPEGRQICYSCARANDEKNT